VFHLVAAGFRSRWSKNSNSKINRSNEFCLSKY